MAGSTIAALSHDIVQLLLGRTVQGIGAAGLMSLTMVILTDLFKIRERAKYVAGINAVWAFGSVSGPIFGGLLVQFASWVRNWKLALASCVIR